MDQRLSLVTLAVRDLERSHQFYITGLGWQAELHAPHEVLMIRVGAHTLLSLWSETEFEAEVGAIARGEGAPPITLAHNVATAEEVDEILTLAARIGAGNIAPGQQRNWGGYSGYFADPDGYRWEIAMNPGSIGESLLPRTDTASCALLARVDEASPVAPGNRHLQVFTKSEPDLARGHASIERILSGAAERRQPVVAHEHPGVDVTELFAHRPLKLTHSHVIQSPEQTKAPALGHGAFERRSRSLPAREQLGSVARHQISRHGVRDPRIESDTETLNDREAITHLTHNHRKRRVERIGYRGKNLARGLFLATLNLAEVSERNACLTGYLTQSATLLQPEVTQHIADLLTNQYHRVLLLLCDESRTVINAACAVQTICNQSAGRH